MFLIFTFKKNEIFSLFLNSWLLDGKNSDKASVIRSKHSVTEQRRRSKINERYSLILSFFIMVFIVIQ